MYITQRFQKSVILLFWLSLGYSLITILLNFFDVNSGLSPQSTYIQIIAALVIRYLFIGITWFAIGDFTKDRPSAIKGFLLESILPIVILYYANQDSGQQPTISYFYWWLLFQLLAYAVFGYFHFKSITGTLLASVVIMYCANLFAIFIEVSTSLSDYGYSVGLRELGTFGNQYVREIYNVISIFIPILNFLIFWVVYNIIKYKTLNFKLNSIRIEGLINRKAFTVIFWSLYTFYFILIINSGRVSQSPESRTIVHNILWLIGTMLIFYVLGSIFRNFTSAFFIQKGKYPSWMYYFINIPFLNIFIWLYLIAKPVNTEGSLSISTNQLQNRFEEDGRNRLIIFLILLGLIFTLVRWSIRLETSDQIIFLLISLPVSLTLALIYYNSSKALYWLIAIKAAVTLIFLVLEPEVIGLVLNLISIFSLAYHYALFHFDKMKFEFIKENYTEDNLQTL